MTFRGIILVLVQFPRIIFLVWCTPITREHVTSIHKPWDGNYSREDHEKMERRCIGYERSGRERGAMTLLSRAWIRSLSLSTEWKWRMLLASDTGGNACFVINRDFGTICFASRSHQNDRFAIFRLKRETLLAS